MSEPKRCECGRCWWNGGAWVASPSESNRPVLYLLMPHWGVDFVAHCPGSCGCRLSVVTGEPRVGEKYADLERDAKRFRAVERAMGSPLDSPFNTHRWHYETDGMDTRYDTLGEYADALGGETDTETGEVEVGPSEAKLLAALQGMIGVVGGCPKVCLPRVGCPANSPAPPPGEACRVDNDNGWQPCWLLHYGLASTYAEAAALWGRMGEAAKSDE
jgi:hypothetical protein